MQLRVGGGDEIKVERLEDGGFGRQQVGCAVPVARQTDVASKPWVIARASRWTVGGRSVARLTALDERIDERITAALSCAAKANAHETHAAVHQRGSSDRLQLLWEFISGISQVMDVSSRR